MAYSLELRHHALALLSQGHDVGEVSSLLKVGTTTLWRWKRREKQGPLAAHSPQKRGFYKVDEDKLRAFVDENPDAHQSEIADVFWVSRSAVQLALQRLQITRKKTPPCKERDEERRAAFKKDIAAFPHEYQIYLDETGICHKTQRTHGYSAKGEPIHGLTYGKRKARNNIIGAWTSEEKLFANQCFETTINEERFVTWAKEKDFCIIHRFPN